MGELILTTILTSAADSLNPIAITQQFILQGLVKKPWHIWFFILTTGITNFIVGLLAYYGLSAMISQFAGSIIEKFGSYIATAELILGIIAIILSAVLFISFLKKNSGAKLKKPEGNRTEEIKIKSVSPLSLITFGFISTMAELATAMPYIGFLAVISVNRPDFIIGIIIMLLYNLIYMSPLMFLYFIYRKKQSLFENFYIFMKEKTKKWSSAALPVLAAAAGIALIFHSSV